MRKRMDFRSDISARIKKNVDVRIYVIITQLYVYITHFDLKPYGIYPHMLKMNCMCIHLFRKFNFIMNSGYLLLLIELRVNHSLMKLKKIEQFELLNNSI